MKAGRGRSGWVGGPIRRLPRITHFQSRAHLQFVGELRRRGRALQHQALLQRVGLGVHHHAHAGQRVSVARHRARHCAAAFGALQTEGQPARPEDDSDRRSSEVGGQVDGVAVGLVLVGVMSQPGLDQ